MRCLFVVVKAVHSGLLNTIYHDVMAEEKKCLMFPEKSQIVSTKGFRRTHTPVLAACPLLHIQGRLSRASTGRHTRGHTKVSALGEAQVEGHAIVQRLL